MTKLHFAKGNRKLNKNISIFDLPAGHFCVGADKCLSVCNKVTGKIQDGPRTEYRCYAASLEALYPNTRKARWNNFNVIQEAIKSKNLVEVIHSNLPKNSEIVRVHSSGDFFSQAYFDAWLEVARRNKETLFYAYTKSLIFWIARLGQIPENFKLVASRGGKFDYLIEKYSLRSVRVVNSVWAAKRKFKLPIDKDDSLTFNSNKSFALLVHNTQPAGSKAAKAWHRIKMQKRAAKLKRKSHFSLY